jgi:26S proteasome regulatory subunit N9
MIRDVGTYLASQEAAASNDPTLAQEWSQLDDLYTRRLWHQLTKKLLEFVKHPALQKGRLLIDLYENFIADFEMRMNALSFGEIIVCVTAQITDAKDAIAFLEKQEPKVKSHKEAAALFKITKGTIYLQKEKNIEATKNLIEEVDELLSALDGVTSVHGRFYLLQSELYSTTNETANYYKSALKFLGCTDMSTLSPEAQRTHAKNLILAALTGEGIFNFGELLAHPILTSLENTEDQWYFAVLKAFNKGDIKEFESYHYRWKTCQLLMDHQELLREKITLLCIMEMTFQRVATERQLSFAEISEAAKIPENQVEIYIMKAIAKGLIKGAIDEVGRKVHMTWVLPRVLNRQQIGGMISRLDSWKKEIKQVEMLMEDNADDILLQ